MTGPAGPGGVTSSPRVHARVLCVACGARFEADGAASGDRLTCPMCREVVELDEFVAEKRRVRSSWTPRRETRRLAPAQSRRTALTVLCVGAVFVALVAAVRWHADILVAARAVRDFVNWR